MKKPRIRAIFPHMLLVDFFINQLQKQAMLKLYNCKIDLLSILNTSQKYIKNFINKSQTCLNARVYTPIKKPNEIKKISSTTHRTHMTKLKIQEKYVKKSFIASIVKNQ